jgi:hypothetical protein
MRTKVLLAVFAILGAIGVLAGTAMASGPAAPGKDIIVLNCDDLGSVTISVQRGENSNGVGQIVDANGHGIPTAFTFTLTDVTTSAVIDSESSATGGGHAHPNQPTTHCSGVEFEGVASDVFGTELPPGVAATDTVRGAFDVEVILKGV